VCDQNAISSNYCTNEEYGTFILAANASAISKNPIITEAIHLSQNPLPVEYSITKTGYYCVLTAALQNDLEFSAIAEFRNAYGELPGAQIAKLPFYGGLALVYVVIGLYWAFLYVQHRHDILPVQNYITATTVFLIFEMITTWGMPPEPSPLFRANTTRLLRPHEPQRLRRNVQSPLNSRLHP